MSKKEKESKKDKKIAGALAAGQPAKITHGYYWCLTAEEKQHLADFKEFIAKKVTEEWNDEYFCEAEKEYLNSDIVLLRFLRARSWKLDLAGTMFWENLKWRRTFQDIGVYDLQQLERSIAKEIKVGKVFLYKRDRYKRPVCYVRCKLHDASNRDYPEMQRFCVYFMEKIISLFVDKIERNCIVFDLEGFSLSNMDYEGLKFFIHLFQNYYPEAMGVTLVLNSPWIFWGCWQIIKRWIDPVSVNKILFVDKTEVKNLIPEKDLPVLYGGKDPYEYIYSPSYSDNDDTEANSNNNSKKEEE